MKTLFVRKANVITELETGQVTVYKSVNVAKNKSRKIQVKNGGLGMGSVMVMKA